MNGQKAPLYALWAIVTLAVMITVFLFVSLYDSDDTVTDIITIEGGKNSDPDKIFRISVETKPRRSIKLELKKGVLFVHERNHKE